MTSITSRPFGLTYDGQQAALYTLTNGVAEVDVSNYGATLVSIRIPDQGGQYRDLLLGEDDVQGYQRQGNYFGALIGRNGNRIKGGRVEINRQAYQMEVGEGGNNLHSAPNGFDKRMWNTAVVQTEHGQSLECSLFSPAGDQGLPGNLQVCVRYSLAADNGLILEYFAKTDADTLVNMTNHAYFNLNGHDSGSVEGLRVCLMADFYTPTDETNCPTGEVRFVKDTPYDFTEFHTIGERLRQTPDFSYTGGYDLNYILRTKERQMALSAKVIGDQSGIQMEVYTNQPAMQFYTGNGIQDVEGKNGARYQPFGGFCLETQSVPNAINLQHFGAPILRAGDVYNYTTVYRFFSHAE